MILALEAALERSPATEISADVVKERPIPYARRRADALACVAVIQAIDPQVCTKASIFGGVAAIPDSRR